MQTDTKNEKALALKKITNIYRTALFCYVFPFFFIVLFIINVNTFHATDSSGASLKCSGTNVYYSCSL